MKRFIALVALLWASVALAADNPIACSGASCKVKIETRDGSSVKVSAGEVAGTGGWTLGPVTNPTDISHRVYGGIINYRDDIAGAGGSGLYSAEGSPQLGANAHYSGGVKRIIAGGTARLYLTPVTAGASEVFAVQADTTNGAANAAASYTTIATATGAGAWTFGTGAGGTLEHNFDSGAATFVNINSGGTTSNSGFRLNESGGAGVLWHIYANSANQIRVSDSADDSGVTMAQNATSWSAISDERAKTNWVELTGALTKVATLRAGTFKYSADPATQHVGLIAQDVLAVQPEAVDQTDPNNYGLRYTEVLPLAIKAIQEMKAQHDALKAEFEAYKAAHP